MNTPVTELEIRTLEDAEAYLFSVKRWKDENGDVSDPGPKHVALYDYKQTVDLSGIEGTFVSTTSDMAYKADHRGHVDEQVSWAMDMGDVGRVYLHLYCMPDASDMSSWAEFWMTNEPWWNGDDPYECTTEQIAAIVRALPEEHRQKYVELASRSPELIEYLTSVGILDATAPAP